MKLLTPSRIVYALLMLLGAYGFYQLFRTSTKTTITDELKERMSKRLARVSKTCQKYNILPNMINSAGHSIPHPPAPQYSVLYYQLQKKMVYCPIYKAASTSMLHWLLTMKGVNPTVEMKRFKLQISELARSHYPSIDYPAAAELLNDMTKWMVVRHPFERILSAYRDKLENSTAGREHGTVHFYEKYGKKIVAKYRPSSKANTYSLIEPTFEEFVQYLIDTDLSLYADDHWIPYYLFCTPCLINYDVIVHFETIEQDVQLLLNLLDETWSRPPESKHVTSLPLGKSRKQLTQSYYSRLSRETQLALFEKYRIDFELFGYTLDDYL